ncbi:tandem-95 repeat protein, partial [Psychromonas marina]|uniref:tandem-95 repeat protein n=1 Tax=Psychromonas marina TaxID=88364 RepID=UPI0024E0F099
SAIAVNDAPVVDGNIAYSVDEDGAITLSQEQLLANATDVDGDELTAVDLSAGGNTTVVANDDGSFTITPDADFNGDLDLSFDVSDGTTTVAAGVDLTVNPVNDAAVAPDVAFEMNEDGVITITDEQLLANATDIDGDDLSVDGVTYTGTDGVLSDNGDGTHSFAPNENFNGDVQLDFGVSDGTVTTPANIDIAVADVNDAPVAGSTSYTVNEDGQITISPDQLLANSSDVDGEVSLDSVSYSGSDGVLITNEDGSVTFSPNENFNGEISLDVVVIDDDGATAETTAGITALAVNDAPVVDGNVAYSVDEDGTITLSQEQLLANATDVDGDDLTAVDLSVGGNATVVANDDGSFTITPDADFNGDLDLSFDVSDGTTTVAAGVDLTVNPINDAAVAPDVSFEMNEDGVITITDEQLLANATDVDGDDLSVDGVTYTGADGVLTDNGNGTYDFAPNENFNGDVQLDFGVSDGTVTTPANIDIAVADVNDAPVAGSTSYTVNEDGQITISPEQLLANSSDVDGIVSLDSVSYSGTDGVLTTNQDGSVTFSPNENFNGEISLDVTVIDDDGATAQTTAGITTLAVNDAPVVDGDIAYSVDEDGTITLSQEQLLANASDVDGDNLTAENLSVGDNATVVQNPDGSFTITPDANFNGDLDLSFDVSDGIETVSAGVDLTVNPVNDAATTSDTSASTLEDSSILITQAQLLANAADIDGDLLSASNLSAENAVILDNGDGTYTVTPDADFNGHIDISYDISDGSVPIAANLGLTVDPVNDAPVVSADIPITIEEDGSYTITQAELLQFASDIDNTDEELNASIGDQGTETTASGTVVDSQTGEAVVGAEVTLSDDLGNTTTVLTDENGSYNVTGPISTAGTVTVTQDGSVTSSTEIIEGADVNLGTTALSEVMEVTDMRIVVTWGDSRETTDLDNHLWLYDTESGDELDHIYYRDMSHDLGDGTVQQDVDDTNGNGPETISVPNYSDANMHYSVHNYSTNSWDVDGVDEVKVEVYVGDTLVETFTPDIPDGETGSHWHVFDIVDGVLVPVQSAGRESEFSLPTSDEVAANTDAINIEDVVAGITDEVTEENTDGTDSQPSIADISIPNGVVTDNGDGTYTITPDENFNGDFSINYLVDDGNGGTAPAQIDVTVTAANDDSIIADQNFSMNEDGTITISDADLLSGATDIDGDLLTVESVEFTGNDGVFADNGDGTYTFTPNENFNGNVDLTYSVSDGTSITTADIDITVIPQNDAPIAGSTSYQVNEDGQITISPEQLLANSSDVDGTVSLDSVSYSGSDGVLITNEDGSVTFSPNENFNGEISLDVVVVDDSGATAETTAGITALAVNDAPVVDGNIAYSVAEDGTITLSQEQLLANATDVDGDTLTAENLSVGDNASVVQNPDGSFTVTPEADFNGDLDLSFDVSDGTTTVAAGVDLTVNPINDAAVAPDVSFEMNEDGIIVITDEQLLANATDIDNDELSVDGVSYSGTDGVLTDNGDGTHSFAPNENFNGDVQLDFGVSDGTVTTPANIDIAVADVNDAPVAGSTSYTVNEDGQITISPEQLLANASDVDGDVSLDSVSYSGSDGVLTTNQDGSVTFSPNENFSGEISLDVVVIDDDGATAETTAGISAIAVNDAPVVDGNVAYSVDEDGTITLSQEQLLANATDVDGDTLTAENLSVGDNASVVQNPDGSFTVTPDADFNGDLDLSFDVSDGTTTVAADVDLTVNPINDAAVAPDVSFEMNE